MINIKEEDIVKYWDRERYRETLITIRCLTFNHEKYIASAIEGFLSQKTQYPFAIYIHDDFSQDRTREIIKSYEELFPNIIRVDYEKENLWSKHDGSLDRLVREVEKTKYIALCEGDDYWTDDLKLQKQVSYLEAHQDCSICITNGKTYDVVNDEFGKISALSDEDAKHYENDCMITLENASYLLFPPTASYVYRSEMKRTLDQDVPLCPTGDLRMRLYLMTKGYAYYMAEETCVYRINVSGSTMTRWKNQFNRDANFKRSQSICNMIDAVDSLSDFKYSDELWKIKRLHAIGMLANARSIKDLDLKPISKVYKELSVFQRLKYRIKILIPDGLYKKYKTRNSKDR